MKQEILNKLAQAKINKQEQSKEQALRYNCIDNEICPDCGSRLIKKRNYAFYIFFNGTKNECECCNFTSFDLIE